MLKIYKKGYKYLKENEFKYNDRRSDIRKIMF